MFFSTSSQQARRIAEGFFSPFLGVTKDIRHGSARANAIERAGGGGVHTPSCGGDTF